MKFLEILLRAARDLLRPEILWHALWPPLAAFVFWSAIAWFAWLPLAAWIVAELPDGSWLSWLGPSLAHVAVFMVFAPLVYFTALLLVAVFALPRMMTLIAARDYPEVSRQGENVFWGSLGNTLKAGAIFLVGSLVSLPLLLIPGVVLVLPLAWAAWLNQRTFRFDALAEHATRKELTRLIGEQRGGFMAAGVGSALVAHIPVVQLLAPAFTALVFVHFGLAALRRQRQQGGIEL